MKQKNHQRIPDSPSILTTTVGSYPIPDWLAALPSEQARAVLLHFFPQIENNDSALYR
jgi:hypothetical protein